MCVRRDMCRLAVTVDGRETVSWWLVSGEKLRVLSAPVKTDGQPQGVPLAQERTGWVAWLGGLNPRRLRKTPSQGVDHARELEPDQ